ncbi:MAG: 2-amino-4-hydroxy-6-hydroxymethyldihydropteridine diphosphokinase [Planctomycetota bacterium]
MPQQAEHDVLIAFGSNLGDPLKQYQSAVALLTRQLRLDRETQIAVSEPFQTEPVGGPSGQPAYVNGAIRLRTSLPAVELHQILAGIETQLGRERRTRWSARKADLDLILFGDLLLDSSTLTVPHPRMSFRRFVLEPAIEIAGDMVHPLSGKTIRELVDHLNRTPDKIVVTTPDHADLHWKVEELANDRKSSGWTLVAVDDEQAYDSHSTSAKLVVYPTMNPENRLIASAKTFGGPTLGITGHSHEDFATELFAAIQGMSPLIG